MDTYCREFLRLCTTLSCAARINQDLPYYHTEDMLGDLTFNSYIQLYQTAKYPKLGAWHYIRAISLERSRAFCQRFFANTYETTHDPCFISLGETQAAQRTVCHGDEPKFKTIYTCNCRLFGYCVFFSSDILPISHSGVFECRHQLVWTSSNGSFLRNFESISPIYKSYMIWLRYTI